MGMLGVLVFMTAATLVQRYLMSFAAVRIDAATLDHLTRRLLALPMSYFSTRRTGDIQRRLDGMQHVREFLVQAGSRRTSAAVQLLATLTMMVVYSPRAHAGVSCDGAAIWGAHVLLGQIPASLLDQTRRLVRQVSLAPDRCDQGHRDCQVDGGRGNLPRADARQFNAVARAGAFNADFTMMSYDGVVQMVAFLSLALFRSSALAS